MNVAIDWGNTSIKVAWFDQNQLVQARHKVLLSELKRLLMDSPAEAIIVSSTNRPGEALREELDLPTDFPLLTLIGTTPVPLEKHYDTPHTLGADRVAAAVGAKVLFPDEDCLVIDMGTCITYDVVDAASVFQGGMISPGFRMRFQAMNAFTERLPLVEPEEQQPPLLAKNTRQAMQAGVINGLQAELNGILEKHRREKPAIKVLLCGGDAPFFEASLKPSLFTVPDLVLIGLNRILTYNLMS
ncbi:type III pantothenate kinase [Tellurirhabdus bombi]|uniref:type III pantothenate kinase n=1 Tax=Tellurirhabdus bombi TaxID=2907205 RepID=UPI001F30B122|nr:type III pantothenate kinase [Tellurirhabdus bombi]